MKVNNLEINGIIIKDEDDEVIAVLCDKGAYFFKGYKVEILDDDLDVCVDPSGNQIKIIKKDSLVSGNGLVTCDEPGIKIIEENEDYEGVIIDEVDFTS